MEHALPLVVQYSKDISTPVFFQIINNIIEKWWFWAHYKDQRKGVQLSTEKQIIKSMSMNNLWISY